MTEDEINPFSDELSTTDSNKAYQTSEKNGDLMNAFNKGDLVANVNLGSSGLSSSFNNVNTQNASSSLAALDFSG